MTTTMRRYNVYKFRMQMYGEPICGVYAKNQKEALALVRALIGPGAYYAYRL